MIDGHNAPAAFMEHPQFIDPAGGNIDLPIDTVLGQDLLISLIRSPAMQRLRHICQLSFSHYIFDGKYSRFTHSLQAAAQASKEMKILGTRMQRRLPGQFDQRMADAVIVALLLHDIGHAPFSHTFENVMKSLGREFHHEHWTYRIINENEQIADAFERFVGLNLHYGRSFEKKYGCTFHEMVGQLIYGEVDPKLTIYQSFVSGARDCDRTVYLITDRKVTGAYKHSFNPEKILAGLDVAEVVAFTADNTKVTAPAIVYNISAKEELVEFLMSWRRQYKKIYLPAPARAAEYMLEPVIAAYIESATKDGQPPIRSNQEDDPLFHFLASPTPSVTDFIALTDHMVTDLISEVATSGYNPALQKLALRLLTSDLFTSINLANSIKTPEQREKYKDFVANKLLSTHQAIQRDVIIDEPKKRDVSPVPEMPIRVASLSDVIFVRDADDRPKPIQALSKRLRNKEPLQLLFVHTATDFAERRVVAWTRAFCRSQGLAMPSQRAMRSNAKRAERYAGML